MVVVAGAYFFSGLAKLLHAGPAWVASGNLRWVLYAASDAQPEPNPFALFVADRPLLAQLVAAATLAVELGFPLVLWRPRLAWVLVPAVVAMHAGIGLAMHLDYSAMAATVLVVFVDSPALADRLRRPRPRTRRPVRPRPRRGATMTTEADLLILGAPVWTGDPARPWADAVAVRGGRVAPPARSARWRRCGDRRPGCWPWTAGWSCPGSPTPTSTPPPAAWSWPSATSTGSSRRRTRPPWPATPPSGPRTPGSSAAAG